MTIPGWTNVWHEADADHDWHRGIGGAGNGIRSERIDVKTRCEEPRLDRRGFSALECDDAMTMLTDSQSVTSIKQNMRFASSRRYSFGVRPRTA